MDEESLQPDAVRIRRTADMPADIAQAEGKIFDLAFPQRLMLKGAGEYRLYYRVNPYHRVPGCETWGRHREVFCWLCAGRERVGALIFEEWSVNPLINDQQFFDMTDSITSATHAFGIALLSSWPIRSVTAHGAVLDFSRLWVRPDHARSSMWAAAVRQLVQLRYHRRYALMLLKPFPLEYERELPEGSPLYLGFTQRQAAMSRLYASVLGAQEMPLGTRAARDGWMWCPLKAGVPGPRKRRLTWL